MVQVYDLCQSALSVPRTKTSSRPAPPETAAGSDVNTPPNDSHGDHAPSSSNLCHSALSVPRTKTSKRPAPQDATSERDKFIVAMILSG